MAAVARPLPGADLTGRLSHVRRRGRDALGVQTYTATGVPQTQGFAIAPGTPATDPAGSNPNWTWWEPMLIP